MHHNGRKNWRKDLASQTGVVGDMARSAVGDFGIFRRHRHLGCRDAQKACELGDCKIAELAKGKGECR